MRNTKTPTIDQVGFFVRCGKPEWFDSRLQCYTRRVEYDFMAKRGDLYMATYSCTDMSGCIDLFTNIDPSVTHIQTWAGSDPDTAYIRIAGKWEARLAKKVEREP